MIHWINSPLGYIMIGVGILIPVVILFVALRLQPVQPVQSAVFEPNPEDMEWIGKFVNQDGVYYADAAGVLIELTQDFQSDPRQLIASQNLTPVDIALLHRECDWSSSKTYAVLRSNSASRILGAVEGSSFYRAAK